MSNRDQRRGGTKERRLSPHELRMQARNAPERTGVSENFAPIEIDATGPSPDDDRVPFFSIKEEGGTREFTIPREIPPNATIAYMQNVRIHGSEVAMAELMADMLGEDAMNALATCKYVTEATMKHLMEIVQDKALGAFEKYQGN